MPAHKLTLLIKQRKLERLERSNLLEQQRELIVEKCLEYLPQQLNLQDRVLFATMCRNIITMPVEQCYKYI